MSTVPNQTNVTVTAHQSHWYTILMAIFHSITASNPIFATFIPAPVEAGIQIATTLGPVVAGTIEAATNPIPAPAEPVQ